jgi:ABC-type Mn2+/Zn2+ transport system permease subunit
MTMNTSGVLVAASMALAAGLLGSFVLLRRMTLAADALSHVALPGIGVAILLRIDPLIGAVAALLAAAVLIWALQRRTRLSTDAVIGVVFAAALATGALLTSGEQLIDALFGAPGRLAPWEMAAGIAGAILVILFVRLAKDRLVLAVVSGDMAHASGVDVRRLDLLYLLTLSLTVALGLRYLGVLLMGSLLIIPPAAARVLARNLTQMLVLSAVSAVFSTLAGSWLAARYRTETGPMIVLLAAGIFIAAVIIASVRRWIASFTSRRAARC